MVILLIARVAFYETAVAIKPARQRMKLYSCQMHLAMNINEAILLSCAIGSELKAFE